MIFTLTFIKKGWFFEFILYLIFNWIFLWTNLIYCYQFLYCLIIFIYTWILVCYNISIFNKFNRWSNFEHLLLPLNIYIILRKKIRISMFLWILIYCFHFFISFSNKYSFLFIKFINILIYILRFSKKWLKMKITIKLFKALVHNWFK